MGNLEKLLRRRQLPGQQQATALRRPAEAAVGQVQVQEQEEASKSTGRPCWHTLS
jgi:hypothetical protein